jgi:hypothetical protein
MQRNVSDKHRIVLLTKSAVSVLASDEDVDGFFSSGGFVVFEDDWSDFAFRRLLQEAEKTNGYLGDLELECSRRILFYPGGPAVPAVTRFIGTKSALCLIFGEMPEVRGTVEFAIDLAPGYVGHGRCRILSRSLDAQTGQTAVRLEFVEFDGVSRVWLQRFVSDGLSLQNTQRGASRRTNEEYVAFFTDLAGLPASRFGVSLVHSVIPFDKGYALSNHPELFCFCHHFLERVFEKRGLLSEGSSVRIGLKENNEKRLVLMISFPMENSVEFYLTGELVLEAKSTIGSFLTGDDLIFLNSQNLSLEQYPDEANEHIAICLEER